MDCSVFYYFRHCSPLEAHCVLLTIVHELPIDMGALSTLLINILLGSFQLFLHSDQPLSGEIIPFSGVCQSGRLHYPRRRPWWLHALTDRLLWCATDDDQQQHHITQSIISSFSINNSLRVFCIERSNITLTHLHVSNCRVHASFSSLAFLSRWAL